MKNTKGGSIYIGVRDDKAICGITLNEESIQNYINQIKHSTCPSIIPDIEEYKVEGKTVLSISVNEYPIKPVSFKGRYFKRKNNSNHLMTAVEIADAHTKLVNSSWDFYSDPYHTLKDISREKIESFIKTTKLDDNFETICNKFELVKNEKITFGC